MILILNKMITLIININFIYIKLKHLYTNSLIYQNVFLLLTQIKFSVNDFL